MTQYHHTHNTPQDPNPRRDSRHHHPHHHHHVFPKGLPPIEGFNLWHRKWSNLAYAGFILFCNLALPCILYYVLKDNTTLSLNALIGISSATLGISSSFDGPFRTWKLWKHREVYGPLNDPVKWHMDFTMHVYTIALFIFAVPLAVASAVHPPMPDFFCMSTPMLVGPIGLIFLISLAQPRLPFWASSDAPGTRMKPAFFYFFEDIGAVDFRHGKAFRTAVNERYQASPPWRDLMWYLTAFWALGTAIYFGITAAITWTVDFDFAFGFVLGVFFIWLLVWSVGSLVVVRWGLRRERRWWSDMEKGRVEGKMMDMSQGEGERVGTVEPAVTVDHQRS